MRTDLVHHLSGKTLRRRGFRICSAANCVRVGTRRVGSGAGGKGTDFAWLCARCAHDVYMLRLDSPEPEPMLEQTMPTDRLDAIAAPRDLARDLLESDDTEALSVAIERLSRHDSRLAAMIRLRYPLSGKGNEHSLKEAGASVGVSGERARQLESKGLRLLGILLSGVEPPSRPVGSGRRAVYGPPRPTAAQIKRSERAAEREAEEARRSEADRRRHEVAMEEWHRRRAAYIAEREAADAQRHVDRLSREIRAGWLVKHVCTKCRADQHSLTNVADVGLKCKCGVIYGGINGYIAFLWGYRKHD